MPASPRPRRSALYVPGSNARAMEKARALAADVLIFDLEDSVAVEDKDEARSAVASAATSLANGRREIVVRINDLDSPWVARDISAMVLAKPDAILVPKVARADDIRRARAALAAAQAPKTTRLWLMVETPGAILNAAAIAAVAAIPEPSVTGLVIGTNDLAVALGAPQKPGRVGLVPHLAHALLAARAHGLTILDGTFNDIEDRKALRAECQQGRDLGFDGKTLIHPGQIATANEVFAPDREEVDWARRIVNAFASGDNTGLEVMRLSGRMVERLHERQARRTLELADAIAALEVEMKPPAPTKPQRPATLRSGPDSRAKA
jgi:citrate lyase subunit beta / citryl-CoA lyase